MGWVLGGVMYAGAYMAAVLLGGPGSRLWIAHLGLMVSPALVLAALWWRRHDWGGCQRVFLMAIGAAALMWLAGQINWAIHELAFARLQPWLDWHVTLQLTASTLPVLALIARPDRGRRDLSAPLTAIDIAVLTTLVGFLDWTLIVAPAFAPERSRLAASPLALPELGLGALVGIGLFWSVRDARCRVWAGVYHRVALASAVSLGALVAGSAYGVSTARTAALRDVSWILPFWLYTWAILSAPSSEPRDETIAVVPRTRTARPTLLFVTIAIVPIVGYGYRYAVPFGEPLDQFREMAAAAELVIGLLLMMVRLVVEERATELAEARLRMLAGALEQVVELIIIVRGSTIVWANAAFCRAFGYELDALRRIALERLVADPSSEAFTVLRAGLAQGRRGQAAGEMVRADGTTFPAECDVSPWMDGTGTLYFIGVVRDTTEAARTREQLVRGERLAAVAELVSGVAHELNNPLQSVIGRVDLLLGEMTDDAARTDLERVRFDAARAGRIVRNLLTFIRKSPAERMLGDLNEVVQATVALREYELKLANIRLEEHYTPDLPLVLVNRDDIQQVVLNLLLNAEAAVAGTRLPGTITVRTFESGGNAVLELADDGPGVPPEFRTQVFEPFFTTRDDATGLGLSIAFGIAQSHGGELELRPSDTGACFCLTLPGAGFAGPAVRASR